MKTENKSVQIDYLTEFEYPLDEIRQKALARRQELAKKITKWQATEKDAELFAELMEFDEYLIYAVNRLINIKILEGQAKKI